MARFADRVKDTTTSTGTGSITLDGSAPTGFRTFASAFGSAGCNVHYLIAGGSEWEVGVGSFNGTTGLTREKVDSSSNAGALVNFSAGSKDVICTASADSLTGSNTGRQIGTSRVGFLQ